MSFFRGLFERARSAYEGLNERERRLVTLLGGVLGAMLVLLPLYLMTSAISSIEEENREIAAVLREVSRSRAMLAERDARRKAAQRRYDMRAPPLGSFLDSQSRGVGLTLREVNDQPNQVTGRFTRRHVRATLPGVGLRPVVQMMANIENSPYPVAIEQIRIDHFQPGDRYNVQIGIIAFDKASGAQQTAGSTAAVGRTDLGPPRP